MGKKTTTSSPSHQKEARTPEVNDQDPSPPPSSEDPREILAREGILAVGKRGRPPIELDPYYVELLASCLCTKTEVCRKLGISHDTLNRRFLEAYENGRNDAKIGLRCDQMASARRGNVSMQIWLGKQELDQRDNLDLGRPKDLDDKLEHELTREELLAIARQGLPKEGESGTSLDARESGGRDHETRRGNGKPPRLH